MKKLSTIIFLFVLSTVMAQNKEKEALISTLSTETCSCISAKKVTSNTLEVMLGLCILESVNKHKPEVEKHYGKNVIFNSETIEKLAEEVGFTLALECPDFLKIIEENAEELNLKEDALENTEIPLEEDLLVTGAFVKTNTSTSILSFILKEEKGKKHEFVVLTDFPRAYLITDNVIQSKEKIKVYYYEMEIYNTKLKKFINTKIVLDIEKQ